MLRECSPQDGYDAPHIDDQGSWIVYDGQFDVKKVENYEMIREGKARIEDGILK